nr:AraC family ligand binding domain-containing protein [Planctomycetota bacterium]
MPARPSEILLSFGLASWHGRPEVFDSVHRHQEIEVLLLEQGTLDCLINARPLRLEAGRLAIFWGSVPHRLVAVSSDAVHHWLTVPLARFLQWRLPAALARPIIAGALLVDPEDRGARDLASFQDWHRDLAARDEDRSALVLLEVEA